MSRTVIGLLVALALTILLPATGAEATRGVSAQPSAPSVSAWLDGRPIELATATKYHCHDVTPGYLTCFSDADDRDADASRALPEANDDESALAAASGAYVIAWDYTGYAGPSVMLTQDYPYLSTIGWNDKISSYKAYLQLTGYFYQHAQYAGSVQSFCCNAQVSSVGSSFNNTFSSMTLP
jgi:hypothetical protein